MTNEEIKKECELMYEQIKNAQDRLKKIRAICTHENTFEGNYSWRPGSIIPTTICSYCLEPVGNGNNNMGGYSNYQ